MNFFSLIRRRATRHWQILLTLSVGVMLSTALLASAPLLVNTVVEFGLRRTILSANADETNLRLAVNGFVSGDPAEYAALDTQIQALAVTHIGEHLVETIPVAESYQLFPWLEGQPLESEQLRIVFYDTGQGVTEHLTFVDGAWPIQWADIHGDDDRIRISALITTDMADAYELSVGQQLPISLRDDSNVPDASIEVVGIVKSTDFREPYWMGANSPLRVRSDANWTARYSVLVPDDAFWQITNELFSSHRPELAWHILIDPQTITTEEIRPLRRRIAAFVNSLEELSFRTRVTTNLADILLTYANQSELVQAPIYLLTAEIVLLTLFYVIMVSSLAVRQVEREFTVMRSRGAASGQIFRLQLLEAAIISIIAFVSGPLLGVALVRVLGDAGPLRDVSQVGWTLQITTIAWIAAAFGALGCIAGLMLPLRSALQRSIVTQQQSSIRDEKPPWWQRLYLDVFVLLLGLVLLWRLQLYGDLLGGGAGRPRLDWLLLLAPLALLLGTGTILLRLFPLLLRILAFLAARGRGLPGVLAMWQVSRNPTHVARLVLLLTISMSLGILTSGLNATLDHSEYERAQHQVGSDVRFVSDGFMPVSQVQQVPGAANASGLMRVDVNVAAGVRAKAQLLAIEPEKFAEMTYYRGDYAERPFPNLLTHLAETSALVPVQEITRFPGKPSEVGVWVWAEEPGSNEILEGDSDLDRIGVQIKLQTAQSEIMSLKLLPAEVGGFPEKGWRYFSTPLERLPDAAYPISLHSFWLQGRTRSNDRFVAAPLRIALDDVTIVDFDSGLREVVDSFEELTRVWQVDGNSRTSFQVDNPHSGIGKLSLSLMYDERLQTLGIRLVNLSNFTALPALVSPAFLTATELNEGDQVQVMVNSRPILVEIVGTVNYFPMVLEDVEGGFLVVDQKPLLSNLNEFSARAVNVNEVILSLEPGADREAVMANAATAVPNASQILDAEAIRQTIKASPMALGLRAVTYFGYVLTTFLSLLGFATHFFMSARQRATSYGVLRAIGLSPRQLYTILTLEQVVLILFGLGIGTGLGYLLNQLTLTDLPITLGSSAPIPPFIPQGGWAGVTNIYLTLAAAFLVVLGIATLLLWRTKMHRVLRIGEE